MCLHGNNNKLGQSKTDVWLYIQKVQYIMHMKFEPKKSPLTSAQPEVCVISQTLTTNIKQ